MVRFFISLISLGAVFLVPALASAQKEAEETRTVFQFTLEADDDWGWSGLWDLLVWSELEDKIKNGVLSKDADESVTGKTILGYHFSSEEESPEVAATEDLVKTLIGAAFPGAGIVVELFSDYRFSLNAFQLEDD